MNVVNVIKHEHQALKKQVLENISKVRSTGAYRSHKAVPHTEDRTFPREEMKSAPETFEEEAETFDGQVAAGSGSNNENGQITGDIGH